MATSSPKKRPISEFFRPYVKSNVPAKRPSPSIEEAEQSRRSTGRGRDTGSRTPKTERRTKDDPTRTPARLVWSPPSAPGSRLSLSGSIPIRSPRPKDPIDPPSTYKRASLFGTEKHKGIASNGPPPKPLSFADVPSSTQVLVKEGEVIEIPDSDDDTDSLGSLESLEDIFGKKKGGHTTSLSSSPGDDETQLEAERVKPLSLFTSGRSVPLVGKEKLRALYAKERASKFDISRLLGDHFDDEEKENNIKQARADVAAASKFADTESKRVLDKKLLAAVATTEDGETGIARLMDAVDRTEALQSERVFLFFGSRGLNDWSDEAPFGYEFPQNAIPNGLWRTGDDESRSRAYLAGYMSELAANGEFPDEALGWTFDSVVLERRDDLRQAYVDCLRNASPSWTRTNVTAQDVQTIFQALGADPISIQDSVEINARHQLLKQPERRDPRYLISALDMFGSICFDLDFLALSKLASMVCRLTLDAELMSDSQISCKVEELLEMLLSLPDSGMRTHVAERILADVGQQLKDSTLQSRLLSHILPTSSTACRLRITLAQTFLFGLDAGKDLSSIPANISLERLADHVSKSPSFGTKRRKTAHSLDYVALRALTQILDVAVSDGARPATFPSQADEHAFNKAVDRLADSIKATFVAIMDTGASHMTRTEAKDVLQALHWRLLYSVRTEVRPKRNIFDGRTGRLRDAGEVRTEGRGKDFMQRFLAKMQEKAGAKEQETEGTASLAAGVDTDEAPTADTTENEGRFLEPKGKSPTLFSSSNESLVPSETERLIRTQLGLGD